MVIVDILLVKIVKFISGICVFTYLDFSLFLNLEGADVELWIFVYGK